MKKAIMSMLVLVSVLVFSGISFAEAITAAPVKRSADDEKKIEAMRARVADKQKEINGSRWEVTLKSQDPKEKEQNDVITFQNNQMSSEYFSKKGFSTTNYTITSPENSETATWETMKTGSDGIVFIRGDWSKDSMQGSIAVRPKKETEKPIDYYFTSSKREAVEPTTTPEANAEASATPGAEKSISAAQASTSAALVSKEGEKKTSKK